MIGTDVGSYSFNKVAKTITFDGFAPRLERFLVITDTFNNNIIYNFADPTKGGSLSGQVLTLVFDTNTVAFNNSDPLQIWYYDENPTAEAILDLAMSVRRMLQVSTNNRDVGSPVGTGTLVALASNAALSTVTQVTTLTQYGAGAIATDMPYHAQMRSNFNQFASRVITN